MDLPNPHYDHAGINFTYLMQPPKKYTFEAPRLKDWVERRCAGRVLNLFAGQIRLKVNEIRVDINKDMPADYHVEAQVFIENERWEKEKFDTIILDPPYNLRKSREKYDGKYIGSYTVIKNRLPRIINVGGKIISFGYDTVGMSAARGFIKKEICIVCHSGDHNDTLIVVEQFIGIRFSRLAQEVFDFE